MRMPKAKPGQLKAQWGKSPDDSSPDICYAAGEGVPNCDTHLLHNFLHHQPYSQLTHEFFDSFIDELKKRGYDITTLKFSVEKCA